VIPLVPRAKRTTRPAARPLTKLTQKTIDDLAPRPDGRRYVRWDVEPRGFGVRVAADAKTFVLKYRLKTGRVRWASLGRVGDVSLERARDKARTMRGTVADGKDPLAQIDAARRSTSLSEAADLFLAEHGSTRKPGTQRMYRSILTGHIRPLLGSIAIGDVTATDARRLQHRLHGTPVLANRGLC
jgi:hypothetical protein